ncbi:type II toxin-antitoxin system VapC family toxin [Runella zeae]|uniref:type II toxin-antitoxin system VapC family toxin n=2 Tax=Runella zeae TaxID=94255 RepID=UPI0023520B05|nr:type II toxin-antitoxin system VapC family toxin [Runella zeae]
MNGINLLLDTNVVLYLLNGDTVLESYLQDKNFYLSFISELELLSYKEITPEEEMAVHYFLNESALIDINTGIKEITKQIRRNYRLKLPDAIVAATAIFLGIALISADNHFKQVKELTFILYQP